MEQAGAGQTMNDVACRPYLYPKGDTEKALLPLQQLQSLYPCPIEHEGLH